MSHVSVNRRQSTHIQTIGALFNLMCTQFRQSLIAMRKCVFDFVKPINDREWKLIEMKLNSKINKTDF